MYILWQHQGRGIFWDALGCFSLPKHLKFIHFCMRLSVHLSLTFWPTKPTWYRQMIPHFPSSNFPIIDDSHNNFYASNIHGKFSAYYPNGRKTLISEEWSCFKRPKWPQTNWYIRKEIFWLSCSWPFTTLLTDWILQYMHLLTCTFWPTEAHLAWSLP